MRSTREIIAEAWAKHAAMIRNQLSCYGERHGEQFGPGGSLYTLEARCEKYDEERKRYMEEQS